MQIKLSAEIVVKKGISANALGDLLSRLPEESEVFGHIDEGSSGDFRLLLSHPFPGPFVEARVKQQWQIMSDFFRLIGDPMTRELFLNLYDGPMLTRYGADMAFIIMPDFSIVGYTEKGEHLMMSHDGGELASNAESGMSNYQIVSVLTRLVVGIPVSQNEIAPFED